jgi:hypothetical protein
VRRPKGARDEAKRRDQEQRNRKEPLPLRMKITLEDALSLLGKYAEERTSVVAAFVTLSVAVVRVTGTIRVSTIGGVSHLFIGKEDQTSDQIKFRLSDCTFEYGDFRDEESGANKFEAFLVVGSSKGNTLSLFEPKS